MQQDINQAEENDFIDKPKKPLEEIVYAPNHHDEEGKEEDKALIIDAIKSLELDDYLSK